jgi:hypothetical protein
MRTDSDPCVKGCVGIVIDALTPQLNKLCYTDFMQGNQTVMLDQL